MRKVLVSLLVSPRSLKNVRDNFENILNCVNTVVELSFCFWIGTEVVLEVKIDKVTGGGMSANLPNCWYLLSITFFDCRIVFLKPTEARFGQ